jgi:hypothetical protein
VCRADWREALLDCLDPAIEQRILETLVQQGPAVDGVTLRQALTIDGLDLAAHQSRLMQLRSIAQRAQGADDFRAD